MSYITVIESFTPIVSLPFELPHQSFNPRRFYPVVDANTDAAVTNSMTALRLLTNNEDDHTSDSDNDTDGPSSSSSTSNPSSTSNNNNKPLYDGTGYTFPDTTTPEGLAEVLEVSFVNACMQLSQGYVDVLKLFIAGCLACYDQRLSIPTITTALDNCPIQTANRPLMEEEIQLRSQWISVVYLTLEMMGYNTDDDGNKNSDTTNQETAMSLSIPTEIRERYQPYLTIICDDIAATTTTTTSTTSISVEDVLERVNTEQSSSSSSSSSLSPLEQAILSQSLRVATLTPIVVEESNEVRNNPNSNNKNGEKEELMPPTPPIEGAFE